MCSEDHNILISSKVIAERHLCVTNIDWSHQCAVTTAVCVFTCMLFWEDVCMAFFLPGLGTLARLTCSVNLETPHRLLLLKHKKETIFLSFWNTVIPPHPLCHSLEFPHAQSKCLFSAWCPVNQRNSKGTEDCCQNEGEVQDLVHQKQVPPNVQTGFRASTTGG